MNKVLAIARLTVYSAVHSRVFASLLALVLLVGFGLPLTIKGDGTVTGYARILLEYTLGLVFILLSLATAWAACGAVSIELAERRLVLMLTKPVHRYQVWLGKWLGIVLMNGILLLIAGLLVYGMLRWTLRPAALTPEQRTELREEVLVAQRTVLPDPGIAEDRLDRQIAELRKEGSIPEGIPAAQVRIDVTRELERQDATISPGGSKEWHFVLPAMPPRDARIQLRYRFSSSRPERTGVRCLWQVGPEGSMAGEPVAREAFPESPVVLPISPTAIGPDRTVRVRFSNLSGANPATVVFEPDQGLSLTIQRPGFEANFLRALLILFFQLAFLAAIGLSAGCLFSMPTATFVAAFFILLLASGQYVENMISSGIVYSPHDDAPVTVTTLAPLIRGVFAAVYAVLHPLRDFVPIEQLEAREQIAWTLVGRALAFYIGLYSGLAGLVGIAFFSRREIGGVS